MSSPDQFFSGLRRCERCRATYRYLALLCYTAISRSDEAGRRCFEDSLHYSFQGEDLSCIATSAIDYHLVLSWYLCFSHIRAASPKYQGNHDTEVEPRRDCSVYHWSCKPDCFRHGVASGAGVFGLLCSLKGRCSVDLFGHDGRPIGRHGSWKGAGSIAALCAAILLDVHTRPS